MRIHESLSVTQNALRDAHGCKRYVIAPRYASGAAKVCAMKELQSRANVQHTFCRRQQKIQKQEE